MTQRIPSLDLIRGFALLGVVLVNAPFFAAPLPSVINPAYGPLAVDGSALWPWSLPYVLFEHKSIALFSMLFGASLFLVGGERGDHERSRVLRRRLGWLALFGILHGVALWFGDILLSYALTGFLVLLVRSWTPRALLTLGIGLLLLSMTMMGAVALWLAGLPKAELAALATTSWSPPPPVLAESIAAYRGGWGAAFAANLGSWIDFQVQMLVFLTARTAGLMMIGMALLKSGFLAGNSDQRLYRLWLGIGAAALALLAWNGWDLARQGFPMVRVQAVGLLITASLAPLVALGYASGLILLLRAGKLARLTSALAATGRMAFTNYLMQSLLLSTLFWSGRGLGLYGELSRPAVIGIAGLLFTGQAVFSVLWLRRFSHGPLEWIWRRLSRGGQPRYVQGGWVEPALAIESIGLSKRFGRFKAVDEVALAVPAGAIYGFLGPNGAGKTTTIRMLLGLMRPTAGAVQIFGHDVQADRVGAARQIGALLEARATYDHLTGRANLDITRRLLRLSGAEVDRVLEAVDLRHAAGRKVGHYSLGMRQRLGLARALLGKPRLLLLDEPMNGLDPDGMADMRRTIRALPDAAGVTVFLSSHLLAEVEQVATHVGLMRGGRLMAQGGLDELLRRAAPDLFVRTGDPRGAHALLASRSLGVTRDGAGLTVLARGSDEDAASITHMMVVAGIAVHEIAPRPADLEQLYRSWSAREAA